MSIRSTLSYTFILTFSILLWSVVANAQATAGTVAMDTTDHAPAKYVEHAGHQLSLGFDITHPIINASLSDRKGYEFEADYFLSKELYVVAEGGWGSSNVNYVDLKYTTKNTFYRFGFNKGLLARENPKDWDMMFIGLRGAFGSISRSAAQYTVIDSLWGSTSGSLGNKNFNGYWAEITGGMRVELVKCLFAGWNIRGKFLLNSKSFSDLSPLYIAGYGRGDKNAVFDFNLYINYSFRWNRKGSTTAVKVDKAKG